MNRMNRDMRQAHHDTTEPQHLDDEPTPSAKPDEDTAEAYRQYLAYLINTPHPRMGSRHIGRHINKCRERAAQKYPKGSRLGAGSAKGGDFGGALVLLGLVFLVFLVFQSFR